MRRSPPARSIRSASSSNERPIVSGHPGRVLEQQRAAVGLRQRVAQRISNPREALLERLPGLRPGVQHHAVGAGRVAQAHARARAMPSDFRRISRSSDAQLIR